MAGLNFDLDRRSRASGGLGTCAIGGGGWYAYALRNAPALAVLTPVMVPLIE